MNYKLNSEGSAAVALDYYWQPMHTCPRGVKVQLLNEGGVAVYGQYKVGEDLWQGWAPMPRKHKEEA